MQNCPNELKLFNYYKTLKPKTKARILRVLKSLFNFYEVPAEGRRVAGGLESKNQKVESIYFLIFGFFW